VTIILDSQHKNHKLFGRGVRDMVFNTTFNNISVISWKSVLLVEENRLRRKPPSHCDGSVVFSVYSSFLHQ